MTEPEFQSELERMTAVYRNAFPPERVAIIYRSIRYTPIDIFREAIDEVIGDSMQPPSLTKIREAIQVVRKRKGDFRDPWQAVRDELADLERQNPYCSTCFNSGTFMAKRRDDDGWYLYTFGCQCKAGGLAMQLPENRGKINQWNLKFAQTWIRESEAESLRPATKNEARAAVHEQQHSHDLNAAIGWTPAKKRKIDEDNWDVEL